MVHVKDSRELIRRWRLGCIIQSETIKLVCLYLTAIVAANLAVSKWGPAVSVHTAFWFIGFDLSSKDSLQDRWAGRVVRNMGLLILGGSALTVLLNIGAWRIAAASTGAFALSASVDALAYYVMIKRGWRRWERMNGSNFFGAMVDSLAFPILAFGWPPMWNICAGQFIAKVGGGLLWSLVLARFAAQQKRSE